MKFSELKINRFLLQALDNEGFQQPTLIQEKTFSPIMSGRDIIGIAQTGTGKTLAYLLPVLQRWKFAKNPFPQILIIVPTRELVQQIVEEVERLTQFMSFSAIGVYGGANIRTQGAKLLQGVDLVVGTPGRTMDLMLNGNLTTKNIKFLVIDEMDETLNLGFKAQLSRILHLLPQKKQSLLFSATMDEEVEEMIDEYFIQPEIIEATPAGTPVEKIEQSLYKVPNYLTKVNLLRYLLADESLQRVLVFTKDKKEADKLYDDFREFRDDISVIHSNKSQNLRFNTINDFKNGNIKILIATDLVARGVDINEVSHVINFSLSRKPENYIHRIGRSGRIGKKGIAISLVTPMEEKELHEIEKLIQHLIKRIEIPQEVEISDFLLPNELPEVRMKNTLVKLPSRGEKNPAFHEKKLKNQKRENITPKERKQARWKKR